MKKDGYIQSIPAQSTEFPTSLRTIASPPVELYIIGSELSKLLERPCVSVVGSRKVSPYGRAVTTHIVSELAQAGVVIISGLALGVDALAHQAALEAGGLTLAVLAGGLDVIYPRTHYSLAQRIINSNGVLLSEYPPSTASYPHHFIARNRLVAGLCQAVLITEAAEKSGTLHTARFALEQGKDVLAVPGNITSPQSSGTNNLIKSGAAVVTSAADVFHILGLEAALQTKTSPKGDTPEEQLLLDLITAGETDGNALLIRSQLEVIQFNQTLTMLEITGKIRASGSNSWTL